MPSTRLPNPFHMLIAMALMAVLAAPTEGQVVILNNMETGADTIVQLGNGTGTLTTVLPPGLWRLYSPGFNAQAQFPATADSAKLVTASVSFSTPVTTQESSSSLNYGTTPVGGSFGMHVSEVFDLLSDPAPKLFWSGSPPGCADLEPDPWGAASAQASFTCINPPGAAVGYEFSASAQAHHGSPNCTTVQAGSSFNIRWLVTTPTSVTIDVTVNASSIGASQMTPIISATHSLVGHSGAWYDPPLAYGYHLQMSGAAQFTKILNFPIGIDSDNQFAVFVGAMALGTFQVGESVDFVALTGGPVPAFEVRDIGPLLDGANALAFPIQLEFDQPTADFTMDPLFSATWETLGGAIEGLHGVPHLTATGTLSTGSSNQLDLTSAKPSSPATLIFGLSALSAPFKGGVMVPNPLLLIVLGTNTVGQVHLPFVMPAVPASVSLYFQFWIQDAAGVAGYAASNGIKGVTS